MDPDDRATLQKFFGVLIVRRPPSADHVQQRCEFVALAGRLACEQRIAVRLAL